MEQNTNCISYILIQENSKSCSFCIFPNPGTLIEVPCQTRANQSSNSTTSYHHIKLQTLLFCQMNHIRVSTCTPVISYVTRIQVETAYLHFEEWAERNQGTSNTKGPTTTAIDYQNLEFLGANVF